LKKYIFEDIGKNYHTIDNDPYSYEDYPGISIESYPTHGGHVTKVTVDFDDTLSAPARKFKTEEEASAYARRHAEKAHIAGMNKASDSIVEQARLRWKIFANDYCV
jgi:hypothetical protein